MHRIPTLTLIGLLATSNDATAQTLNAAGNTPVIGSSFTADTCGFTDPGAAGAGVNWNFSGLTSTGTVTYEVLSPTTSAHAGLFPSADYALSNATDTLFYESTASGLERVGEDVTFAIFEIQVPFTDGQLDLELPASLGTTWTDIIAASYDIDGVGATTRSGSITGNVDGEGTVQLPWGEVWSALRVHTRLDQTDAAGVVTASHTRDQWDWYVQWLKHPFLRIVSDTIQIPVLSLTRVIRNTEWLDAAAVGLSEQAGNTIAFHTYPNPATDRVTIAMAPAMVARQLVIIDALGRMVKGATMPAATGAIEVDVADLPAGCYTVRIIDTSGSSGTARLIVH